MRTTVAFHNSSWTATMKLKNNLFTLEPKSTSVLPIPLLRKAVWRWQQYTDTPMKWVKFKKKAGWLLILFCFFLRKKHLNKWYYLRKIFGQQFYLLYWPFFVECVFAGIFLMIYMAIYYATEYEPLNTGTPVFFFKGFLILLPSIYNIKKIITAYKAEDFATVFGFLSITIIYTTLIALLGGGGR